MRQLPNNICPLLAIACIGTSSGSAESEKFHVYRASDLPKPDNSRFLPCSLDMLYQAEPGLKEIAARAVAHKRQCFYDRLDVYTAMKKEAEKLVGWFARDPRLRTSDAWDCFFDYVLEELRL